MENVWIRRLFMIVATIPLILFYSIGAAITQLPEFLKEWIEVWKGDV
jgi:hypothetical protein